MHYVYKFICDSKEDFLYKCKFAGVKDGRITEEMLDEWFDRDCPEENLIGDDNVWTVDSAGRLACYASSYAKRHLQFVKDITICELNLGGL